MIHWSLKGYKIKKKIGKLFEKKNQLYILRINRLKNKNIYQFSSDKKTISLNKNTFKIYIKNSVP